ncbi:MAG: fused MFS/spermidine synthase, partial [Gemmatimonadetes bacterium]|nr:fused MFS/spermidine synthase [Gemmatimonadota bacterium]
MPGPAPTALLRAPWVPQATVFVSSFCIMVLELVAGRVISRHLGSSLYTWTSVIGIVLAGIAVGNWIGGRLADRRAPAPALSVLFLLSALGCVLISFLNQQVGNWVFLWTLPWSVRVGAHVAIVFLLPSVILGMISPVAAKMALDHSTETGRTIGGVYAWGVAGSIAGTFATGFWLIAAFGTAAVIWAVGGVLALMGVLYGAGSRGSGAATAVFVVFAVLGTGPWAWAQGLGERLSLRETEPDNLIYVDESQYSHIRVYRTSETPDRRNMHLDKLLHSTIVLDDPDRLEYGYERIYGAVTELLAGDRDSLNTLTIGGGGYVFPRWIDRRWPRSRTEVVEIDPDVTRAAMAAFGLPADHGFVVAHEDGRAYTRQLSERRRRGERVAPYDFLYLDVFNDFSVPYQLTTVEFLEQVNALLAEDGAFMMNLIDVFSVGRFMGSVVASLQSVFPHVVVFAEGQPVGRQPETRNTYILVATREAVDLSSVVAGYDPRIGLYRLTDEDLTALRERSGGRVLTDDWAPVENLLAPVVKRASREIAAGVLTGRARTRLQEGDAAAAERAAGRAAGFDPRSAEAHQLLASARLARDDADGAIAALREVTELRPSSFEAWQRLGVLQAGRGRHAE